MVYEQLGSGGMATVHRAEQRGIAGFRRVVALKRLHANVAADPELLKAFIHEARLASYLKHTNVAQTFDLGKVGDTYFIAMEFVAGPTLGQLMRQCTTAAGPIPLGIVLSILSQICDALDHAHNLCDEAGRPLHIIHRDISPSNVIVSNTGTVKLIDFGIAKANNSDVRTQTGLIKGKFGYIAPEYLTGQLDARGDLFGVGVISHELLAGRSLFLGRNDFDTLSRLREMPILPPSHWNRAVTPVLDDIVMTALARDPEQRWQSAAAMRNALNNAMRDHGGAVTTQQVFEWVEWAFMQLPQPETSAARHPADGLEDPSVLIEFGGRASRSSFGATPTAPPPRPSPVTPTAPPPLPSALTPGGSPPSGFTPDALPIAVYAAGAPAPPTSPGFPAAARRSGLASDPGVARDTSPTLPDRPSTTLLSEPLPPETLPASAFAPEALTPPGLPARPRSRSSRQAITPSSGEILRATLPAMEPDLLAPETLPASAFAPETLPPSELPAAARPRSRSSHQAITPSSGETLPGETLPEMMRLTLPAMEPDPLAPETLPPSAFAPETLPPSEFAETPPSATALPPILPPVVPSGPPVDPSVKLAAAILAPTPIAPVAAPKLISAPQSPAGRAKGPSTPPVMVARDTLPSVPPVADPRGKPSTTPPPSPAASGVRAKAPTAPQPGSAARPPPVPSDARARRTSSPPAIPAPPPGPKPPPVPPAARTSSPGTRPPPPRASDADSLGATDPHLPRYDGLDTTDPLPRNSTGDVEATDPSSRNLDDDAPPGARRRVQGPPSRPSAAATAKDLPSNIPARPRDAAAAATPPPRRPAARSLEELAGLASPTASGGPTASSPEAAPAAVKPSGGAPAVAAAPSEAAPGDAPTSSSTTAKKEAREAKKEAREAKKEPRDAKKEPRDAKDPKSKPRSAGPRWWLVLLLLLLAGAASALTAYYFGLPFEL